MKQTLTELKGEIHSNTVIVRDFNTSLLVIDGTPRQKIKEETKDLNNIIDQRNLTDACRTV